MSLRGRSPWVFAGWLLTGLAFALLIGHLLVYVHYAIGLMRFPFDYDQGEGFELVDTMLFSQGEWPYRDNETYPFYASNYPPLFHVILVPFAWVFGPAYWYGRLAGFVGTLITAVAIGGIVYREERHRGVAALAGLAFLASNYVYHVGPLFRQHMTMVMFETLAVAVLAQAPSIREAGRRRWALAGGMLLLLAAGYTKQHAVVTCAAVFAFLLLRNPRRAVIWGAGLALAAGGLFLWIDWATGGAWWTNIIAANVNEYYLAQFTGLFRQWLRLHGALIVVAALFALYELYAARLSLYTIWWGAAVVSTVLAGKWGAGDSYFATAIAATCVLSGLAAARALRRRRGAARRARGGGAGGGWLCRAARLCRVRAERGQDAHRGALLRLAERRARPGVYPRQPLRLLRRGGLDAGLRHHRSRADADRREQRLAHRRPGARGGRPGDERRSRLQPARGQRRDHQPDAAQNSQRAVLDPWGA
ncbi:MAG: hypothetical protein M5U29_11845 [Anaerolineae bacterium]|nr:hypothetical protein [Anaerolineae bacterium]